MYYYKKGYHVDYVYAYSGSDEHIDFYAKHIPQAKVLRSEDRKYTVLPPFQNVGRFGFSRFIVFAMHLDITYV